MEHNDAIRIEMRLRSLAGACERGDYQIDADLIEPGMANWYTNYGDSLPDAVYQNEVFQKWVETFRSLGSVSEELADEQLQSFIDEFCGRL